MHPQDLHAGYSAGHRRWVVGLSSGTTADGVDAALLELRGVGLELRLRVEAACHLPFPKDLRARVRQVSSGEADARQAALLHRLLGETFARSALQLVDQAGFDLQKVQCVGCQGHTVCHEPEGKYPHTLGLGMAAVVAERTGLTTVSDFRSRDLAVGGQGLPLTALADHMLFRDAREHRAVVNLGGVSSVVFLPAGRPAFEALGFQAGPCCALLDGLIERVTNGREPFDAWGKHAVQGKCLDELLERWLNHPLLQRRPPRSIPRQEFGPEFVAQALSLARGLGCTLHDVLCTATHLVARCVADAVDKFLPARPHRVLLSGGGVRNGLLRHLLAQRLAGVEMGTTEDFGVPVRGRKAVGFGALAALLLDGVPGNLTSVTGAAGSRLLGQITPGSSANWARCLSWMAGHTAALAAA